MFVHSILKKGLPQVAQATQVEAIAFTNFQEIHTTIQVDFQVLV
jgi:hypothetical protein